MKAILATGVDEMNNDLRDWGEIDEAIECWTIKDIEDQIDQSINIVLINRYMDQSDKNIQLEDLIRRVRSAHPAVRFVIIVGDYDQEFVRRMVNMGVFDLAVGTEVGDGAIKDLIINPRKDFKLLNAFEKEIPNEPNFLKESVNKISELLSKKTTDVKVGVIDTPREACPEVQKREYGAIESKTILILNGTPRGGSTFVALLLASALAKRKISVSLIEPPVAGKLPYLYEHLLLEHKDIEVGFDADKLQAAGGELFGAAFGDPTVHCGITLQILNPQSTMNFGSEGMRKLLYGRNTAVKVIDAGSTDQEPQIRELAATADQVLVLVDLLPGDSNVKTFTRWADYYRHGNMKFVLNKINRGVDTAELAQLETLKPLEIHYVDPVKIYASLYQGNLPYFDPEIERVVRPFIETLLSDILPKDVYYKTKIRQGLSLNRRKG